MVFTDKNYIHKALKSRINPGNDCNNKPTIQNLIFLSLVQNLKIHKRYTVLPLA